MCLPVFVKNKIFDFLKYILISKACFRFWDVEILLYFMICKKNKYFFPFQYLSATETITKTKLPGKLSVYFLKSLHVVIHVHWFLGFSM